MATRKKHLCVMFLILSIICLGGACSSTPEHEEENSIGTSNVEEESFVGYQRVECGDAALKIPNTYVSHEIPAYEGTHDRQAFVNEAESNVIQLYYMDTNEVSIGIGDMISNFEAAGVNPDVEYDEDQGFARMAFILDGKSHQVLLLEHEGKIYFFELAGPTEITRQEFNVVIGNVMFE